MPGDTTTAKLIALFVFDKMEVPLSEDTIVDMCAVSNNWIPHMECRSTIFQLKDAGFIHTINASHSETLYSLTPEGRVCLAHFFIRIPSTLRENISEFVKGNRLKYRKRQEYLTDYFKNADGSYTVLLKIIEPTQPVLEIKMTVPSRHTAKWINKQWEEKASGVYALLYEQLVD